MRIFLVRHGESLGNTDKRHYQEIADHAMPLTEKGRQQGKAAGEFLRDYLAKEIQWADPHPHGNWPRMWVSPYTRARQTADEIQAQLLVPGKRTALELLHDRREHLLLAEQQFGALDGIAGEDVKAHYPAIAEAYDLAKAHGGKLFARAWGGESRFDVCVRVHQAFGTFQRDRDKHNIRDIIVVAHGTTCRAFAMMWLHHEYEWFDTQANPGNGSVRLIEAGIDKGYIHPGG